MFFCDPGCTLQFMPEQGEARTGVSTIILHLKVLFFDETHPKSISRKISPPP